MSLRFLSPGSSVRHSAGHSCKGTLQMSWAAYEPADSDREIILHSWDITVTTQGPKMEGKAGEVRQDRSSEEEELESDQWSPASGSRDRGPSVL